MKKVLIPFLLLAVFLTACDAQIKEESVELTCKGVEAELAAAELYQSEAPDRIKAKTDECDTFPAEWSAEATAGASASELDAIVEDHNACLAELETDKKDNENYQKVIDRIQADYDSLNCE